MQALLPVIAAAGHSDLHIGTLILHATLVAKGVMGLLALMSITCWYIVVYKLLVLKRARRESEVFTESFWRSRDIEQIYKQAQSLRRSPISAMFLAGYQELAKLSSDSTRTRDGDADLENIERALRKAQTTETMRLEAMIPFLATTGSAGPFIGLFGTVWGIMTAFGDIGAKKTASVQTVAPGIAEALIATAIGLVAAIPAVMAYNYFQRQIRVQTSQMETFAHDYLNIIRRHFLK